MNITRLAAAAVTLFLCSTLSAQTGYEEAIRQDPDRAAGVHHSYEYIPSAETPAPRGYKPAITAATVPAAPPRARPNMASNT